MPELEREAGIPSHDTLGRLFGLIDPEGPEAAFRRWVVAILPALGTDTVVVIDGRTRWRTDKVGIPCLRRASLPMDGSGVWATAAKSNEKTAIPGLLATLMPEGGIVTLDAMGTQTDIAQLIRQRGADYVLVVRDNQPGLADSMRDFFDRFETASQRTPHTATQTVEKNCMLG